MRSLLSTPSTCPSCKSRSIVDGRILSSGSEDGNAERFYPAGIKLLTLTRSVQLTGRQNFKACTSCGHVWNTLDAGGLRELIETRGTDELKRKVSALPNSSAAKP
jgi:hypothetical protein